MSSESSEGLAYGLKGVTVRQLAVLRKSQVEVLRSIQAPTLADVADDERDIEKCYAV